LTKDKFYDFRDYTVEDLKKPEQQMGELFSLFMVYDKLIHLRARGGILKTSYDKLTFLPKGATTFSITALSIMTLSIMTLSIMTISILTLSIMTLSIMTLSILTFSSMTISITTFSITINEMRYSAE
jgi:hypothetical protein